MKQLNYDIWLSQTVGAVKSLPKILDFYGSPRAIYEDTPSGREKSKVFTREALQKMEETSLDATYLVLEQCYRENIDILCPEDPEYPFLLTLISDAPRILYAKGNLHCWQDKLPFAMVGTRNAGLLSRHVAGDLAGTLTRAGLLVVSGGALGIDSASHIGALNAGGETVAVLGAGFGADYLRQNESLRTVISQNGALLSELPPGYPSSRGTFPRRNRIIAGMTAGTLVIEAQIKSGSLITSKAAQNYNREVMAVPGEELSLAFSGSNQLLKDGATPVRSAWDVIRTLYPMYPGAISRECLIALEEELFRDVVEAAVNPHMPVLDRQRTESAQVAANSLQATRKALRKKEMKGDVSPLAQQVYAVFDGRPLNIDGLLSQTGLTTNQLLGALTELELTGYLEPDDSRNYNFKQ